MLKKSSGQRLTNQIAQVEGLPTQEAGPSSPDLPHSTGVSSLPPSSKKGSGAYLKTNKEMQKMQGKQKVRELNAIAALMDMNQRAKVTDTFKGENTQNFQRDIRARRRTPIEDLPVASTKRQKTSDGNLDLTASSVNPKVIAQHLANASETPLKLGILLKHLIDQVAANNSAAQQALPDSTPAIGPGPLGLANFLTQVTKIAEQLPPKLAEPHSLISGDEFSGDDSGASMTVTSGSTVTGTDSDSGASVDSMASSGANFEETAHLQPITVPLSSRARLAKIQETARVIYKEELKRLINTSSSDPTNGLSNLLDVMNQLSKNPLVLLNEEDGRELAKAAVEKGFFGHEHLRDVEMLYASVNLYSRYPDLFK